MIAKAESKIWETGNSFVITIPKALVSSGVLKLNRKYRIIIKEVD